MHLSICQKYAGPIFAFSQRTIYGMLIIKKRKFSIGLMFLLWRLIVKDSKGDFCQFLADSRHKIDFIWFQNIIWTIKPSINAMLHQDN